MPCNSHHIRVTRRRNSQPQQQQQASNQQQQGHQSQQVNQQTSQNAPQPACQQNISGTTQSPQVNIGSQSTRLVQPVAPMPAPDRFGNLSNTSSIDAVNSFVTIVSSMANRNLGQYIRRNLGPRTNSAATNTTGSGVFLNIFF